MLNEEKMDLKALDFQEQEHTSFCSAVLERNDPDVH